jgi:FLVCR family feline leukemia virus subgroup C receptor-related protein
LALACFKDKPAKPPGSASLHAEHQIMEQHQANDQNSNKDTFRSIKELCVYRDFQLLTLSYGINVGCFYAVSTVLNQMVAKSYPNPDDLSGTMGLLIVVSGMLGSVLCGQLLDRTHAFKIIIVLIYLLSLVSMIFFTLVIRLVSETWLLYLVSATLGFFMTGYLPLGFEFAAEITYPHPANTPAGLLNLSAQVRNRPITD